MRMKMETRRRGFGHDHDIKEIKPPPVSIEDRTVVGPFTED